MQTLTAILRYKPLKLPIDIANFLIGALVIIGGFILIAVKAVEVNSIIPLISVVIGYYFGHRGGNKHE
jgi:hypothetical protein